MESVQAAGTSDFIFVPTLIALLVGAIVTRGASARTEVTPTAQQLSTVVTEFFWSACDATGRR